MTQRGAVFIGPTTVNLEFPSPEQEVVPGVLWGSIDAFPSPAYWAYQALARRLEVKGINYRLGRTLKEEVAACLLGGHGIPAAVGLAAFQKLKSLAAFEHVAPSEEQLLEWLSEPMDISGRLIRYRFARQKARYLAAALTKLSNEKPPKEVGRDFRDWLMTIPGIGYKTASWITRNWLDANDVAILDIHILRAGLLAGFFPPNMTVERHYLKLESLFIEFSNAIGVKPSELDAIIWYEMQASATTVFDIIESYRGSSLSKLKASSTRPKNSQADSRQALLLI